MAKNGRLKKRMIAAKVERGETRCWYCGVPFYGDIQPTLDCVRPRALGGELSDENTVLACLKCNNLKGVGNLHSLREKFAHGEAVLNALQCIHLGSHGIDLQKYFDMIDAVKFFGEVKG